MKVSGIALIVVGVVLFGPPLRAQSPPPSAVKVMATGAIRASLDVALESAQRDVGMPIAVEYGSARGNLKSEILGGQRFDLAILTPDVIAELRQQAATQAEVFEIATVDIGIGLRGDVAALDVSTPAALKKAMLAARSIKYSATGAAVETVKKIVATLGIEGRIADTSHETQPVALAPGEFELDFYPLSEILANKPLRNLGPVIRPMQVPVSIDAVIGAKADHPREARRLVKFLQSDAFAGPLKQGGMRKGHRARSGT